MWDTDDTPFIQLSVMSKFVITAVNFINETHHNITLELPEFLWVQHIPDARNYSSGGWGWVFINSSYYIIVSTPEFNWSGQGYHDECNGWVEESFMEFLIKSEPESVSNTQPIHESAERLVPRPGKIIYEDGLWYGIMWNTPHVLISISLRDVDHGEQDYIVRVTIHSGSELSIEYPLVREYRIRAKHEYLAIYVKPETVLNVDFYSISVDADTIMGVHNLEYQVAFSNHLRAR